jgi:hypothetical protein
LTQTERAGAFTGPRIQRLNRRPSGPDLIPAQVDLVRDLAPSSCVACWIPVIASLPCVFPPDLTPLRPRLGVNRDRSFGRRCGWGIVQSQISKSKPGARGHPSWIFNS